MSPGPSCRRTPTSSTSRCGRRTTIPARPSPSSRPTTPAARLASYLEDLSAAVADGSVPAGALGRSASTSSGATGSSVTSSLPDGRQPARHVPDRARVQGTRGRLHRASRHDHRHLRVPEHHRRRPRARPGHAGTRIFAHAEERRLFYVALTRARRAVILITPPNRMSPFVVELLEHSNVAVDGDSPVEICPKCGIGTTVRRPSLDRPFLGCSTFPACDYKRSLR